MPEELGGKKFDEGKPRYDLLPVASIREVVRVLTKGSEKYDDHNWRKGFIWSRPYAAAQRHLNAWWDGENLDVEWGISHLAHAICNLLFLLEFELTKTGTDDRYKSEDKSD